MNGIQRMKKDDLIWTRRKNVYYICRVKNNKKYHFPNTKEKFEEYTKKIGKKFLTYQEAKENDIWHFVECDFYEVGTEEKVLGCIVNNIKAGRVTQRINKGEQVLKYFSMTKYNSFNNYYKELPCIDDKWNFLWSGLLDYELEELVGLYLQVELGYGIYTSTNKKDTKQYEFVLFKRDSGEKAYLQVKEHDININEYKDLIKYGKVYIFSNNETQYEEIDNIVRITRNQIIDFIKSHKKILPDRVKYLLDLSKGR